ANGLGTASRLATCTPAAPARRGLPQLLRPPTPRPPVSWESTNDAGSRCSRRHARRHLPPRMWHCRHALGAGGAAMTTYAASTEVSSSRSREDIERTLQRYGADQFLYGWQNDAAIVGFRMKDRKVRFILAMPAKSDKRFTH